MGSIEFTILTNSNNESTTIQVGISNVSVQVASNFHKIYIGNNIYTTKLNTRLNGCRGNELSKTIITCDLNKMNAHELDWINSILTMKQIQSI